MIPRPRRSRQRSGTSNPFNSRNHANGLIQFKTLLRRQRRRRQQRNGEMRKSVSGSDRRGSAQANRYVVVSFRLTSAPSDGTTRRSLQLSPRSCPCVPRCAPTSTKSFTTHGFKVCRGDACRRCRIFSKIRPSLPDLPKVRPVAVSHRAGSRVYSITRVTLRAADLP